MTEQEIPMSRLLFINPTLSEKSNHPSDDVYTEALAWAISLAEKGTANLEGIPFYNIPGFFHVGSCYRGFHRACDGELSDNFDYLLQIPERYITNSLAVHYLRWFRSAISEEEWVKINIVKSRYEEYKLNNLLVY